MEGIELDYFKPLTRRLANVTVKGGLLSADGRIEYAPTFKEVDLRRAEIAEVEVEYVNRTRGTATEKAAVRKVERATAKVAEKPGVLLKIEQLDVTRSTFAFANAAADPPYRLFVNDLALHVRNITNQSDEGLGNIEITGKFMGTGPTMVKANYRPAQPTPNLDVQVRITDADMKRMNDFWKAHAEASTWSRGEFSFYSELSVRDGMLTGYVKPLLKDVDVYDPAQDRKKNVVRQRLRGGGGCALDRAREPAPRRGRHAGRHLGADRQSTGEPGRGGGPPRPERLLQGDPPRLRAPTAHWLGPSMPRTAPWRTS